MEIIMLVQSVATHLRQYLIGVIGASSAFMGKYLATMTTHEGFQLTSLALGSLVALVTLIKLVVDWVIPTLRGKSANKEDQK